MVEKSKPYINVFKRRDRSFAQLRSTVSFNLPFSRL